MARQEHNYGVGSTSTDRHKVEPYFSNPFDPDKKVFWVICPSHQVSECVCVCVCVYMYVCMCILTLLCACMYLYVYTCRCLCVCTCMCVYAVCTVLCVLVCMYVLVQRFAGRLRDCFIVENYSCKQN